MYHATTLAIVLHFFAVSLSMPQCHDTTYGRTCQLPSQPTRTLATRDGILVGATNTLYLFDSFLSYKTSANLTPPYEATATCKQFHPGDGECLNYVLVLTQVPLSSPFHAGEVLVCGTNARQPKCYFFNPSDLSRVSPLSNDTSVGSGYCPFQPAKTVASLATSNGYFFSGTTFNEFTSQGTIGLARNALRGDKMFVTTSKTIQTWINNGDPSFISIYELSGCVYFFLTEQAAETGNTQVYSRVVRVCINDTSVPTYGFRSFQKVRIICTNAPDQSSLAYSYDELKAMTLSNGILYGIFSSAANGPKGAAICKFQFDSALAGSITAAFGAGKYLTFSGTNWQQQTESPFSCPGASRTVDQIANNVLLLNPIQSLGSTPLLQVLGTTFTAIAADTFFSFGRVYEVLYYALDDGGIEQLVVTNGLTYRSPLIAAAGNRNVTIGLILRNADKNVRQLYATTDSSLDTYTLGNCSLYVGCLACLQLRDPYCVWNISAEVCVSRLDTIYSDGLIEGFALNGTAVFGICRVENTATYVSSIATSTTRPPSLCVTSVTSDSVTPPVLGVEQQAASSVPVGVVVGATVGGFSAGVPIGVLLCAVALIVKRMVFTASSSDGCAEVGVCEQTCKNGGTPKTVCKPDNTNNVVKGVVFTGNGDIGPTHNTVDSSYQGGHEMGSQESGDDDVIAELGVTSGVHVRSTNKARTESTRCLITMGSNESSVPDSPPV